MPAPVTLMHCVVAPVFHEYEDAPGDAHKLAEPPEHILVFPVMVQAGGDRKSIF